MAAPTRVGSAYTVSFSSVDTVGVTIISGFTAGNSVAVLIQQAGSVERTVDTLSDGTNSYPEVVKRAGTNAFVNLHAKAAIAALVAGGTVTLTLSGSMSGRLTAQEITASVLAGLTDTFARGTGSTSQQCGATGLTTAADVFIFGVACMDGDHFGVTPGDGYTTLQSSGEVASFYKGSNAGLTSSVAPFDTVGSRGVAAALAAFYTAGYSPGESGVTQMDLRTFPRAFMRRKS